MGSEEATTRGLDAQKMSQQRVTGALVAFLAVSIGPLCQQMTFQSQAYGMTSWLCERTSGNLLVSVACVSFTVGTEQNEGPFNAGGLR